MIHSVVVGLGSIGRRHAKNLINLGCRVSVVRTRKAADAPQKKFLALHDVAVSYDLEHTLREKPDAVIVANPTSLHVDVARQALASGAHVFVEKPVSHTLSGTHELIRIARRKKLVFSVGYHFRHHPQLRALKQMIDRKVLGEIFYARFTNGEYLPDWHPWEPHTKSYAARRELGGGVALTQSHDIDTALWLFGIPTSVRAHAHTTKILDIDVDDIADFSLSAPGAREIAIHLDYLAKPPVKTIEIYGTKGSALWNYHRSSLSITKKNGKTTTSILKDFDRNDMYVGELRDFFSMIRKGTHSETGAETAIEVLKIALTATKNIV